MAIDSWEQPVRKHTNSWRDRVTDPQWMKHWDVYCSHNIAVVFFYSRATKQSSHPQKGVQSKPFYLSIPCVPLSPPLSTPTPSALCIMPVLRAGRCLSVTTPTHPPLQAPRCHSLTVVNIVVQFVIAKYSLACRTFSPLRKARESRRGSLSKRASGSSLCEMLLYIL